MLRHPALKALSRDHQHALGVALRLPRGLEDELDLAAAGRLLDGHVRLEERAIFPWTGEAMPEEALDRLGEALRGL